MIQTPQILRAAKNALLLLGALNILSMTDRYLLPSVQPLVQQTFGVGDGRMGSLSSAFLIAFLLAVPVVGWLGDRVPRTVLIGAGALGWSAFTFVTGSVHTYRQLYWVHAGVGFGEASLSILSLSLLADFYPEHQRTKSFAFMALTTPIGASLGYVLGGALAQYGGWRTPFRIAGVIGALVGFAFLALVKEPHRGAADSMRPSWERATLRSLLRNGSFLTVVGGMSSLVFGMVGIAVWLPTYYVRFAGYTAPQAAKLVGAITLISGVAGTCVGAFLTQRWLSRTKRAPLLVSAWGLAACAVLGICAVAGPIKLLTPLVLSSEFFLFFNAAPLNVALVNAVHPRIRATGLALALFSVHAFGDAISPALIGYLSERYSLRWALCAALLAIALGGVILFARVLFSGPDPGLPATAGASRESNEV